ncbi:MAG TPA: lipocalin family protein [Caulobacteraceae bacterium]
MKFGFAVGAFAVLLGLTAPALAGPAQPARPVATDLYSGRWYEIARTPNRMQSDCQAPTTDFSGWVGGVFKAVQTCHKGAATGPQQQTSVDGKVLPATQNTKMTLAMLGGLISQQYWILDHADDNHWLIMSTANQHYVWLMSRYPVLTAAEKSAALARLQSLGFNLGHLAFPQQLAR